MNSVLRMLTRTSLILAAAIATALSAAEPAKDDGNRIEPVVQRVVKMKLAEQQAWLRRLEQRAARAARLTLAPDVTAQQQAKTRSRLHQKAVTLRTLREVIAEIDARENEAVDQLVRRYNRVVEEHFANQADERSQRQKAWRDLYSAWHLTGRPFEQQDHLLDWLEAAIVSANRESPSAMPEPPTFDRKAIAATAGKPAKAARPKASAEPASDLDREIKSAKAACRPGSSPLPPPRPATSTLARSPVPEQLESQWIRDQRSRLYVASKLLCGVPAHLVRAELTPPQIASGDAVRLPRFEQAAMARLFDEKVPRQAMIAERAHKAESVSPSRELPGQASQGVQPASHEADAEVVQINQDELSARIDGFNLAIRALETELDEKGDWNVGRLAPLIDRLKKLATRRHDLDLFREAASNDGRASLPQLASVKSVVSQFAERVFEARNQVSGVNFKGTDEERQGQLRALEDLSRRLAESAEK